MSRYDWLLTLHLLSAFALMGGLVATASLQISAVRRTSAGEVATLLRLAEIQGRVLIAGAVGTLVFGVWLALDVDGYSIGDGWILAAIVAWVVASAIGGAGDARTRAARVEAQQGAGGGEAVTPALAARLRDPLTLAMNWGSAALYVAILVLMIWKPGA